jgi:hypothetical protein
MPSQHHMWPLYAQSASYVAAVYPVSIICGRCMPSQLSFFIELYNIYDLWAGVLCAARQPSADLCIEYFVNEGAPSFLKMVTVACRGPVYSVLHASLVRITSRGKHATVEVTPSTFPNGASVRVVVHAVMPVACYILLLSQQYGCVSPSGVSYCHTCRVLHIVTPEGASVGLEFQMCHTPVGVSVRVVLHMITPAGASAGLESHMRHACNSLQPKWCYTYMSHCRYTSSRVALTIWHTGRRVQRCGATNVSEPSIKRTTFVEQSDRRPLIKLRQAHSQNTTDSF